MKFFKDIITLSPWPGIYRWNWIVVSLFGFLFLYGLIHLLLVASGEPMFSEDMAIEIGDLALAVYMGLVAVALKGHRKTTKCFYYSRYWYLAVGVVALIVNVLLIRHDFTKLDSFSTLSIVHFVLVPIFSMLVAGVMPLLLFGVKGHRIARMGASASCAIYLATLVLTLGS